MKIISTMILVLFHCALFATPVTISSAGVDASDPQVGIDQNGNSVAVWIENGEVISKNCSQAGTWSAPSTLSTSSSSSAQLVVDLQGNATAVWIQNGVVTASTQPVNGSWQAPVSLSENGASTPKLAVNNGGNVVAVWNQNGAIQSSTLPLNGTWITPPEVITNSGGDSPQIAIGNNGNVVAVWHAAASSVDTIYSANKILGSSWSTPVAISQNTTSCNYPKIAVDPLGNAMAIWFSYELSNSSYTNVLLQAAYCPYTQNWSTPVDLSMQGNYDPSNLLSKVLFDANGNSIAMWNNSYDGSTFDIESSIKPLNGDWSQTLGLVGMDLHAISFDMVVDSQGHAVVIYMTYDRVAASLNILCRRMDIFGVTPGWSIALFLSEGSYNAFPKGAAVTDGTSIFATGVWMSFDGSNTIIQATTGIRSGFPPPSNLTVVQNSTDFNLFKEFYNTLTWNPSPYPATAYYLVFRNGEWISTVPATVLQYVDDNQIENGTVTYGVAAQDVNRFQSEIITAQFP